MIMSKSYYGDNYDKAMRNYAESERNAKLDLLKKYPHATLSKFEFEPNLKQDGSVTGVDIFFINSDILSTDITSTTFKNDKSMWKWLHNNVNSVNPSLRPGDFNPAFPRIWSGGGTVQELLLTDKTTNVEPDELVHTFPPYVLDYQIHNFDIYVDEVNSFRSNLPKIVINTKTMYTPENSDGSLGNKTSTTWTLNKDYYQALTAMYVTTYRSGVSKQHLTRSDDVPKQVTSLMRFFLYFTVRRLMFRMSKSTKDIANIIRLYVPDYGRIRSHLPLGGDWNLIIKNLQGDYRRYCARTSNGMTKVGQELLNQAIEVYMYALLGAQAKSKQSIVGSRASAREVQQVFRNIVEDAVIQYSPDVWINLMNKAISDTNVKLDMAVTPSTWLIPSKMVLLKTPIPGYNNLLRVSSDTGMKFGYNSGLNYKKPDDSVKPKKVHNDGGESLKVLEGSNDVTKRTLKKQTSHMSSTNSLTNVIIASLVGVVVSKFVL